MAAAQPITDDFLKCPICLEIYIDPKYLPCLHTFCRACLQSYITSSFKGKTMETKTKVEFSCPICRTVVHSPYPVRIEEITNLFPSNRAITSVLDKQKKLIGKLCDSCLSEEVENPAKTWCKVCCAAFCDDCTKYHRKMPISKKHKLVQLFDMDVSEMKITKLEFCDIHRDELVKAFCKDHDKACCVMCVTIEHRKCNDVTSLEVAAEGIKERPETQDFLKHLRDSENALAEMLQISKRNVNDLAIQKVILLEEVTSFRKLIDKHLNDLEAKLKEEIVSVYKKSMLERTDHISSLDSNYAVIMNYRKTLEACLQKESDVHALLELKKVMTKTKQFEAEITTYANDMKEIKIELSLVSDVQKLLSIQNLGKVDLRSKVPNIEPLVKSIQSKGFIKTIVKAISTFEYPKLVQSATFLPNGKIVLAMVNLIVWCNENGQKEENTSVIGSSKLNGVTVLRSEIFLSRTSGPLIYSVDICTKTRKKWKNGFYCHNIINTGEKFIAACEKYIAVLNYEGENINEIQVRGKNVCNIAFHGGIIYYAVPEEHVIRAVSLKGEEMGFEYSNPKLWEPHGIDTDTNGTIYVAGYASSNIHQISKDGHLIKIILTAENGILNPEVVCLSKTGNRLLISHSKTSVNLYELC